MLQRSWLWEAFGGSLQEGWSLSPAPAKLQSGVGPTGTAAPPLPPAPGPAGPADTGPDAPWPYGPAEGGGGWPCCPHRDSNTAGTDPGPSPIPPGPGGAHGLRRTLAVWARA